MKRKYTYELDTMWYLPNDDEIKKESFPEKESTITITSDVEIDRESIRNCARSKYWSDNSMTLEKFVESVFDFLKDSHDNLQITGVEWDGNGRGKYTYTLSQNYKEDKF